MINYERGNDGQRSEAFGRGGFLRSEDLREEIFLPLKFSEINRKEYVKIVC